jgi:hypothetical protein
MDAILLEMDSMVIVVGLANAHTRASFWSLVCCEERVLPLEVVLEGRGR